GIGNRCIVFIQQVKFDADRVNYIEVGTWYYFNKNMNVYTAYKFNLLDKDDAAITDAATDDQFAVGIVYQF
ncbi:porin, partial [Escherichia sp. R-CC3]